jgi:hypothetical protein
MHAMQGETTMNTRTLQKLGSLATTFLAASLQIGCSTGAAPVEPGGNTLVNGSLVWYVDAVNGSNYGDGTSRATAFITLAQAEAVALPGDTVLVETGTYTNATGPALDIKTPGSASGGYITFEAAPGATPVIQVGPYAYGAVQFEQTAAYIIFKGFTVLGNNKSLTLSGAQGAIQNAAAQQNIIYNGNCIGIQGNTSYTALGSVNPNHIQILNNTVAYCGGGGIGGEGADYVTISGNTIYDSAWYTVYGSSAISLLGSYDTNLGDTTTKYKMQITNNVIYGNEEFIPWDQAGKITDGEAIILDSNNNSAYTGAGLNYPPYTGRFLIANNVIYNDGSSAIEVFESSHADIVNNSTFNDDLDQASQNGRGEIELSNLSDVNIYNNIFYASAGSAALYLYTPCTPLPCTSDYNIYYASLPNQWGGSGSNGSHDLNVNPMYTSTPTPTISGVNTPLPSDQLSAPAVNLNLLAGSPAIGKGTSNLAPPTDILGNPRPSANGYTMGAYSH